MEDSEEIKVNEEADQQKDNENGSEQQNEQEDKDKVCCKSCLASDSMHSNMLGYVTSAQRAISEINHSPRAD
jgi:hypothetical protein